MLNNEIQGNSAPKIILTKNQVDLLKTLVSSIVAMKNTELELLNATTTQQSYQESLDTAAADQKMLEEKLLQAQKRVSDLEGEINENTPKLEKLKNQKAQANAKVKSEVQATLANIEISTKDGVIAKIRAYEKIEKTYAECEQQGQQRKRKQFGYNKHYTTLINSLVEAGSLPVKDSYNALVALQTQISTKESELNIAQQKLDELTNGTEERNTQLAAAEEKITKVNSALQEARANVAELKSQSEAQRNARKAASLDVLSDPVLADFFSKYTNISSTHREFTADNYNLIIAEAQGLIDSSLATSKNKRTKVAIGVGVTVTALFLAAGVSTLGYFVIAPAITAPAAVMALTIASAVVGAIVAAALVLLVAYIVVHATDKNDKALINADPAQGQAPTSEEFTLTSLLGCGGKGKTVS